MKRLTALMLILTLLCGCASMYKGNYYVVEPHNEQYEADEDTDVLTVENFAGLKNAILSFVEAGMENGVIRVHSYDGDVTTDVAKAAYEVASSDPLGAFAIEYLTHDCTRIVSYYELHIYITYRKTMEDIQSIVRVSGDADQKEKLKSVIENLDSTAFFRYSYFSDTDYGALIDEICAEDPMLDFGDPQVTASLYPESGVQRIVELSIQYNENTDVLSAKKDKLKSAVESAVLSLSDNAPPALKAYRMFCKLVNNTSLDSELQNAVNEGEQATAGQSATAYGALVEKLAVPQGFAEAYYLLCNSVGIECQIVHGRKNGYDHDWNMIKLEDDWYHVDAAAQVMDDSFQGFLLKDSEMEDYLWSEGAYPKCQGKLSYNSVVPGAVTASSVPLQ